MENRVSRTSSSRSATASEIDDALYPAYHHYRPGPSLAASTRNRPVARPPSSPARDNGHPLPENVFADPVDSPPPSPTGSAFYSNSVVTPTPSVRRPSLSLSARRSPSPLPGANGSGGGGGYYYSHHRLSQSLTPSVRSSSSSTYGYGAGGAGGGGANGGGNGGGGGGLNRSNTTGTNGTGYSTLSSIPSNMSDFTSPPSPLPPIAPVRPQWNYSGHQQNIYPDSVYTGSVVPEEDDPFADDFMIPVGDGFAPHHQRPQVATMGMGMGMGMGFPSGPGSVGSVEPPPYTRYPKPEEVGTPLMQNGDSGIDVGATLDGDRRDHREAAGGVGLLLGGGGGGGGGGDGRMMDNDGSGASKEWRQKRVFGFRLPATMAIALVLLLAVGLGVGLGLGLKSSSAPMTVYPTSPLPGLPPNSEESGPPLSSPNATYPAIPTGLALVSPLMLSDSASSCGVLAQDASAPSFFRQGADLLWSCQFDQTQVIDAVSWRFDKFPANQPVNMEDFVSMPPFLRGAEYGDGKWGAYLVSSVEGIQQWEDKTSLVKTIGDLVVEYSGKPMWRDGAQNQPLWNIPFGFYNNTVSPSSSSSSSSSSLFPRHAATVLASNYTSYKFGVLVNKTVVLKRSTIDANTASKSGTILTGNGTVLVSGEIVWKCIWEKTLLEVELFVNDPSEGFSREGERAAVDNETSRPHSSHGSASPTGSPPLHGTGGPTSVFFDTHLHAQPTGSAAAGNLSDTYKRSSYRRRTPAIINTGGPVGPYPRRISIQESRPTSKRIRQVLGMDLTDPDPDGHANLGAVRCTQFVATADGGLSPFLDKVSGEGYVVLMEQSGPGARKRRSTDGLEERGGNAVGETLEERDSDCFCRWSS